MLALLAKMMWNCGLKFQEINKIHVADPIAYRCSNFEKLGFCQALLNEKIVPTYKPTYFVKNGLKCFKTWLKVFKLGYII